jgi:nitrous oxidase accessory protein NosD
MRPPKSSRAVLAATLAAAAALAAASPAGAWARVLHVSTRGSDAGQCTASAPCRTIGHAVAVSQAGGRITVHSGTYAEHVTVSKRLTLVGRGAEIDAAGAINGLVLSGAGAAGSTVRGFEVENAIGEGILAVSTSDLQIVGNRLHSNDKGASTPVTQECANAGNVPGDCGEALHLMGVADSRVLGNVVERNVGGILVTDETGPSHGNLIARNVTRDNLTDCGITLPSHNGDAVADPSKAGVYDNTVAHNLSQRNGGAGVGMFAPFPGTASYDNQVIGNTLLDNGEAGVAIHAHAPGQDVSGNVIVGNRIAGNGVDPDSGSMHPTGIALFSAVVPTSVVVADNWIAREFYGIFIAGPVTVRGLHGNQFARTVTTPVGHAPAI